MERVYRSFYTNSDALVSYMVKMLSPCSGNRVLEPCAGHGIFVDALLCASSKLNIDARDLNPEAVKVLHEKYNSTPCVDVAQQDFLTDEIISSSIDQGGIYDRIIANPPYGGWQDYEKRLILKKRYPDYYVKETYGLFLLRCVELLKPHGRLVFIVPDTYLNLHLHTPLRRFLLTNTRIEEIVLFPSSFFPGINFGYSNLSIISLEREPNIEACKKNILTVRTGFKTPEELAVIRSHHHRHTLSQQRIFDNLDSALYVSGDKQVMALLNSPDERIGDVAACVTGFYSGNDRHYLCRAPSTTRGGSKYREVDIDTISQNYESTANILNGLSGLKVFIPIVKGGGERYVKPNAWFMNWSTEAVSHFRSDKKARFQNSGYYFRQGVAVPMVSSKQISASLLDRRLFDQSIVGVFPKDEQYLFYLLAFFNSTVCNRLIRTINPSANNSAKYISKLPFIRPDMIQKAAIDKGITHIIERARMGKAHDPAVAKSVMSIVSAIYGFDA